MKNIKGKDSNNWMKEVSKNGMMYPSFCVDENDMPIIKGWETGKEYKLNIKVKMASKDTSENMASARLEVLAYEDLTDYSEDPSTPKKAGGLPNSI